MQLLQMLEMYELCLSINIGSSSTGSGELQSACNNHIEEEILRIVYVFKLVWDIGHTDICHT